jgi:sorting nexin-8
MPPKSIESIPPPEIHAAPEQDNDSTHETVSTQDDRPKPYSRNSFGTVDADPWSRSPELNQRERGPTNGTKPAGQQSSATYTAASQRSAPEAGPSSPELPGRQDTWAAFGSGPSTFPDSSLVGGGGAFGDESGGDDSPNPIGIEVPFAPRIAAGPEEVITIVSLPEKEGMLFFQHRNYQVTSARRNSKVIRRYSDFVWLLDCLQKRYPFRQLPLLPPKRVGSKCIV